MAIKLIGSDAIHVQCLSTDERPSPPDGSTCHIIDTGEEFIRHDGMWEPDLRRIRSLQDAARM
jgi:hypothetical protein